MIGIFDDDGERLPIVFNTSLTLNQPIGGDPTHIYEVNLVLVRDVFASTEEPRPSHDGTEIYSVRKASKLIRIDGIARAPTFAKLSDMGATLRSALDPALLSKLDLTGHGVAPLQFTVLSASGNQNSYVLARPVATPDSMFDQYLGKNAPFRLEFFCADPRRYLLTSTLYTQNGSGLFSVTNNGNYPSIPTISIAMVGAGSSAYELRNNTSSPAGRIFLNLSTMINGDDITIFPNEKVLMKNDVRADNLVVSGTNWDLFLLPGGQTIEQVNGTNANLSLTAFHAFSM